MEPQDFSSMFLDLLRQVCKRPQLYPGNGDFQAIAGYLEGFASATSRCHPGDEDPAGLGHFRNWLARRYARRCGLGGNLGWWVYLQAAFPEPEALFEQLPGLFEESLHARRTAGVARGACIVYYGIRVPVRGSEELSAMDDDPERSLRRVAGAGLESWWIPSPVPCRLDTLLIGTSLGVFYRDEQIRIDDASLAAMMETTQHRLRELGYTEVPALLIEWDASHPRPPDEG